MWWTTSLLLLSKHRFLYFKQFNYNVSQWASLLFAFILLAINQVSWEPFSYYFFKYSALFSLPFFWDSHLLVCLMLAPHRFLRLCSFWFFFFFLLIRLNNFNWPINFIDSFFCLLKTALNLSNTIFNVSLYTFQLQNFPIWVSFYNFYFFVDIL